MERKLYDSGRVGMILLGFSYVKSDSVTFKVSLPCDQILVLFTVVIKLEHYWVLLLFTLVYSLFIHSANTGIWRVAC